MHKNLKVSSSSLMPENTDESPTMLEHDNLLEEGWELISDWGKDCLSDYTNHERIYKKTTADTFIFLKISRGFHSDSRYEVEVTKEVYNKWQNLKEKDNKARNQLIRYEGRTINPNCCYFYVIYDLFYNKGRDIIIDKGILRMWEDNGKFRDFTVQDITKLEVIDSTEMII